MNGKVLWKGNYTVTDKRLMIVASMLFLFNVFINYVLLTRVIYGMERSLYSILVFDIPSTLFFTTLAVGLMTREGWMISEVSLLLYTVSRFVALAFCVLKKNDLDDQVRFLLHFLIPLLAAIIFFLCKKLGDDGKMIAKFIWFLPGLLYVVTEIMYFHFYEIKNPFKYMRLSEYAEMVGWFLFLFSAAGIGEKKGRPVPVSPAPTEPQQNAPVYPAQPAPGIPVQAPAGYPVKNAERHENGAEQPVLLERISQADQPKTPDDTRVDLKKHS